MQHFRNPSQEPAVQLANHSLQSILEKLRAELQADNEKQVKNNMAAANNALNNRPDSL